MTRLRLVSETRRTQYGFTLVEMMISILVAGIVMAAVYQLLIGQSRSYGKQRELMDVHETLRSAAALLAWEMRQASAADGDLYAIGANSITLRSSRGGGTVCVIHPTEPIFGLRGAGFDEVNDWGDDSLLVYVGSANWNVAPIDWVDQPGAMGVGNCELDGGVPDLALELGVNSSDAALIQIGAPVRAFRRVEYGLYHDDKGDGRWWLGRRVAGAGKYEKLTGPLLPPAASGGLVFTYRDAAGNVTANPTQVAVIDFVLRAQSYRVWSNAQQFQQDTLATRVALRG